MATLICVESMTDLGIVDIMDFVKDDPFQFPHNFGPVIKHGPKNETKDAAITVLLFNLQIICTPLLEETLYYADRVTDSISAK